jgi:hypothetical protein
MISLGSATHHLRQAADERFEPLKGTAIARTNGEPWTKVQWNVAICLDRHFRTTDDRMASANTKNTVRCQRVLAHAQQSDGPWSVVK